jgi:hypothetical protein
VLKIAGHSPPSNYLIEKTMEGLESGGYVARRYESVGNAKLLWILKPSFNQKYGSELREYFYKHKENLPL